MKQESVTADLLQLRAVEEAVCSPWAHTACCMRHCRMTLVATHAHPLQPRNTCWGHTETV